MNNVTLGGIVKTNDGKPCFKITFDKIEYTQNYKKHIQKLLEKEGFNVIIQHAYYDQKPMGGA